MENDAYSVTETENSGDKDMVKTNHIPPSSTLAASNSTETTHTKPKKMQEDLNAVSEKPNKISEKSESTTALVELKKEFGLWNGVGLSVGIMIGSGIFVSPGSVVKYAGSVGMSLAVWVVTGLMSMVGALCYSELGTTIPKSGGAYTYILEAFGPVPAFLDLWIGLIVQSPGSRAIGLITFGNYLLQPFFPDCPSTPYLAVRLVALATLCFATYINCAGVKFGTTVQDSLAVTKVLALIVIIVLGGYHIARGHVENYLDPMEGTIESPTSIATAFYASSFAYGGWSALNTVMEELKDPYRNLPWAVAISLTLVTVIYTLTNMAYFAVLTPAEILASSAVAVTFGNRTLGVVAWIISIFVACSTFGNLNGGLIAQSRVVYVGARDGQLPKCLALIHVHNHTPVTSIIGCVILPAVMLFVGDVGSILAYTSFTGSITNVMCVTGLLWMRYKEPDRPRPIKMWIGIPIFYLILSIFMAVFPIVRKPIEIGVAILVIIVGLVVYYFAIHLKIKVIGDAMDKVTYVCQMMFQCTEQEKTE